MSEIDDLKERVRYLGKAHRLRDELPSELSEDIFMGGGNCLVISCNDIFMWGCADAETLPEECWKEFADEWVLLDLDENELKWYAAAWSVRLRQWRPQKPAIDGFPSFVSCMTKMGIDFMSFKALPGQGWPETDWLLSEDV